MGERYAFVIMIKEKWWNEFRRLNRAGKTNHAYVQRGFGPPKDGELLFFYVVKPVGEIQGYAEFRERVVGEADAVWKAYGRESCLQSRGRYEDFLKGARKASFIRFTNLYESSKPIRLNDLLISLRVRRLPRRGFYINKEVADTLIKMME
jgi:predicted transcriptional regulator